MTSTDGLFANLDVWDLVLAKLDTPDYYSLCLAAPVLKLLPGVDETCKIFEEGSFPCWLCFRRFRDLNILHKHVQNHPAASDVSLYFPQFCLRDSNGFLQCSLCTVGDWRIFEKKWYLKRHLKNHHKLIRCTECNEDLVGLSLYRSHVKCKHVSKSVCNIQCTICRRKFRSRQALGAHVGCHFRKIENWGWETGN